MNKIINYLTILLGILFLSAGCSDSKDTESSVFTVVFDSRGGSEVSPQAIEEGQAVSEPAAPVKDGYIFGGWYKEEACENAWNFAADAVTANITLYAGWIQEDLETYTVSFDSQGGSEIDDITAFEGYKITAPDSPLKYRTDFGGWYKEASCENEWIFDTEVVTEDLTLYAKWDNLAYPGSVFIATDGNDENDGTFHRPFATLGKAKAIIDDSTNGLDTIYMRGGTYKIDESQIMNNESSTTWTYVFDFSTTSNTRSGSSSKRICYWGFPGERPVFDLSEIKTGKRIIVFYVTRHYHHFKNFEITGTQVTVLGHTQSECFRADGGNNNTYENIAMHDGMAIGFYLVRGTYNLVLNCDAYNNYDNYSEGASGGNVDGFGGHPNATGVGNVFRGCRAWWNSDDGFDLINAFTAYTIENCWSFYNGYQRGTFDSAGDGAGFKSGGYGMSANPSVPSPIPMHTVKGCLAYRNKNQGFYANHHLGGIEFYNNTGYFNPSNFNMLNRKSAAETIDDPDGGYGHILKNNLSYGPRTSGNDIINVNVNACTISNNSFLATPVITITESDFITVDHANATQLTGSRKADGSLPDITFLKPATGSQVIGAGEDLGISYTGTTLGCFQ